MNSGSPPEVSALAPRRHAGTRGQKSPSFPELNLTMIARTLGIAPSWLGRILNGQVRPSMELAERIAAVLGWSGVDQVNRLYKHKPKPETKETKETKEPETKDELLNAQSRDEHRRTRKRTARSRSGKQHPADTTRGPDRAGGIRRAPRTGTDKRKTKDRIPRTID